MSSPPPLEQGQVQTTAIPKVFGIIHIIYALLGWLGAIISVVVFFGMTAVMSKLGEDSEELNTMLEGYNQMAIYTYIDAGIKVILGAVLLISGIGLLKKKLWAQKVSIFWAVTRVILVIVMTVITYGSSRELQDKMGEISQNQPGQMDQSLQSAIQGGGAVMSIIMLSVYPVLCLIFLSKKSVKDALS